MIPVNVVLMNGNTQIRWTNGEDIGKKYYYDLSSTDQSLLDDMYFQSNSKLEWEDYINQYDADIDIKNWWKTAFFLRGNDEQRTES